MNTRTIENFEKLKENRYERLRQELINERGRAGLKQAEVADKLRKPQSYVSKIERGERKIDVVEFVELAEIIGFDPQQVLQRLIEISF